MRCERVHDAAGRHGREGRSQSVGKTSPQSSRTSSVDWATSVRERRSQCDDWPDWTDDSRWTITEPTTPIEVLSPITDGTPVYEPTAEELADYHAYRDEQDRVHSAAWKAHLDAIDSAEYATRQRLKCVVLHGRHSRSQRQLADPDKQTPERCFKSTFADDGRGALFWLSPLFPCAV